jgi:hypothetical protein
MSYSDFTFQSLRDTLGLHLGQGVVLFAHIEEVTISEYLQTTLQENVALALNINTETSFHTSRVYRRRLLTSAQPSCHNPLDTSHSTGEVIMSRDLANISAKLYLLRPEEGGRKMPIFTGYRPAVYFGGRQTDGLIVFDREEKPVLGGEYTVTIALAHPEYLGDALQKDATFDCREGPKIIGRGKVLKVEETKS